MVLRSSWIRVAVALAGLGCGGSPDHPGSTPDAQPVDFDRRGMLADIADGFLVPLYEEFAATAGALTGSIAEHCAALAAGDAAASPAEARAAWVAAIDLWERADSALVGPVMMDHRALRDRVYAWPLASSCGIDQDVVSRWANPAGYDVASRTNNVRSLAAIEYLLFSTSPETTCPLEPPGWSSLGGALPLARCQLARDIAADVAAQADALWQAWDPARGDYGAELAAAGTAGSSIASEREAINLISDALFYVDWMVKDMKLAEAAGISDNACGLLQQPCLREVEHRHADHATPAIRINLASARDLFTGNFGDQDRLGFEDYLRAVGADALADQLLADLDAAIAAAEAIPASFLGALDSDYDRVVTTHAAVKQLSDNLKTQFLTVLGLDIPDDAAGDND